MTALAQSATQLSVSTPTEIDLVALVKRNATKAIKGATTERLMLNNSKLMNLCRADYKSQSALDKSARLPDELDNKLQSIVNEFITSNINRVHAGNALTFRTYDALDFRNFAIVEKVSASGQNTLELQRQIEGCNRLLRVASDKLAEYRKQDANGNSMKDYAELIKKQVEYVSKLEFVREHVRKTIAEIKTATQP